VLAQRVEQLADPGGLCITAALHESLPRRMPFDLEDLGDQVLKGFDDPVHVYRVELSPGASIPPPQHKSQRRTLQKPWKRIVAIAVVVVMAGGAAYWFKTQEPKVEAASIEHMAFPLPDKPSIVVLPFTNMSGDPEQEYFTDGITEDLITDLSKISDLFVIARNSAFTYKGHPVKVKQVAEELGVRYVLEGSVRRVAAQVRINAQLIDATTGGHLWAERYDGDISDIFALQDKVTLEIVTALAVNLTTEEQEEKALTRETENLQAYDAYLKGREHYSKTTRVDNVIAIQHLEQAVKLDPNYSRARALLAAIYYQSWRYNWAGIEAKEKARQNLKEAMKNPTPLAHQIASSFLVAGRRWEEAAAEAKLGISLDPNDPAGYKAMGKIVSKTRSSADALGFFEKAIRLNPVFPDADLLCVTGYSQFAMKRFEESVETLEKSIVISPGHHWSYPVLAAAYGYLGRNQEAKDTIATYRKLRESQVNLEAVVNESFQDSISREHMRIGLRNADVWE
jgi:adenylate cyclase